MSNIELMPGVVRNDLPAEAQPQAEVISCLRQFLEEAERGEVQAITICYVRPAAVTGFISQCPRGGLSSQLMSAAIADMFFEEFADRSRKLAVEPPAP